MRKIATRDELRAQTRAEIIAAAEELFLTNGYHATTMAQVAMAAYRTSGAIYGNFSGKEELCEAVLRPYIEQSIARLTTALCEMGSIPSKLDALEHGWRLFCSHAEWATLAAEYLLASRGDPEHARSAAEVNEKLCAAIANGILSEAVTTTNVPGERAVIDQGPLSITATSAGLILFSKVLRIIDDDTATAAFMDTVRAWLLRCGLPAESIVG